MNKHSIKDGNIIPFDVQNDCPYIVKGGVTSAMRDPYDLEIATGVSFPL